MTSEVAIALVRPPYEAGAKPSASMAALMHSNNEPVAISNPISTPSTALSSPEPISFLKAPSKPDTNLSSIASAGLHVSRSQPSQMTTPASAPADRPIEQEQKTELNNTQVAREALGASERSPAHSIHDPSIHASPEQMQVDTHANDAATDPYGSTEHHQNSLMQTSTVASPGPIEESASQDGDRPRPRAASDLEQDSNKAFSYPMPSGGPGMLAANTPPPPSARRLSISDPRRGLSLPDAGYNRGSLRSPSAKKHRCPYCATEFTRQHNLKSHLLTHSQEKPFVCQTCQSRFRRLHDLKRHSKLHTGERPHICPKCGRRFARGDALARHNKGQGGCAGRRSSMGSFAGEDEYGDGHPPDDTMDGLVYAEPERMDEEDERRLNMPSIRKPDADSLSRSDSLHPRQPSTYPPIAAGRALYPPPGSHGGSGPPTTATSQPGNMTFPPAGHQSGSSVFTPTNVGDSPKPLSPNALSHHDGHSQPHRAASPAMGQSLPHPQPSFARTGQPNHAPTGLGLPPPPAGAPHLPPPVISSPDARFGLQAPAKHTSSHGHSSSHPGFPKVGLDGPAETNNEASQIDRLWQYVRSMHDEMTGLREEVASLRAHIATINPSSAPAPVEINQANSGPR
ncbi:hypothetical protein N7532_011106 [Penicillium argentinense]|uniref:C2H2-type domain-containing protein n=1 Tax=Penicillium argentinense TaxID=1131581 RepID=A0A9W9JUG3_9EURO|nr:uncharacterized protein N7532_011106 [Penicillium argentinense]KAJ5082063.1 hypothetical protein N7532_011106 [Penicillium argentinense]